MRQKTGRKLLGILLALAMVLGLVPGMSGTAHAAEAGYAGGFYYTFDDEGTLTFYGSGELTKYNSPSFHDNNKIKKVVFADGCGDITIGEEVFHYSESIVDVEINSKGKVSVGKNAFCKKYGGVFDWTITAKEISLLTARPFYNNFDPHYITLNGKVLLGKHLYHGLHYSSTVTINGEASIYLPAGKTFSGGSKGAADYYQERYDLYLAQRSPDSMLQRVIDNARNAGCTITDREASITPMTEANASDVFEDAIMTFNPPTVAVTGVTLNPSTPQNIDMDESIRLTANVEPGNATNKKVEWSVAGMAVILYSDRTCQTPVELNEPTSTLTVYAKGFYGSKSTVSATSGNKRASCEISVRADKKINIANCTVTAKNWTYTGKAITPEVKVTYGQIKLKAGKDYTLLFKNVRKVGMAEVTIEGQGNFEGSQAVTFKIVPVGTSISNVTANNQVTVKWKRQKNITGYQIQYSLNKDFSNSKKLTIDKAGTLAATLGQLEGGQTYYLRVRTYKKVEGKNFYSAWSGVKTVKTKGTSAKDAPIPELDEIELDEIDLGEIDEGFDEEIIIDEATPTDGEIEVTIE